MTPKAFPILRFFSIALAVLAWPALASDTAQSTSKPVAGDGQITTYSSAPWTEVSSVLNKRCVVCHSCYDAPCQLKLTSPAGILRGASKDVVYQASRLSDAQPTRLGLDATTPDAWHALGFFPVTTPPAEDPTSPNLIAKYLEFGRSEPLQGGLPVPDDIALGADAAHVCPTPQEFENQRAAHPKAGMPYAAARLDDAHYETLITWALAGAPVPDTSDPLPDSVAQRVNDWESFLNAADQRQQLTSRYLYEHLFLARLHFDGDDPRRFFQIVRSTTPPGEAVDIIATRRPFDSPRIAPFYYRLKPVDEVIVHKEHLVYTLNPDRMRRFKELFIDTDWTLDKMPPYGTAEGGNPFSTFAAIPAQSRYQFLLDDALFFVRSFIRGPVCHGQTATDVVEDRFWVTFLDPEADISVTDPTFLAEGADLLELPVSLAEGDPLESIQGLSHSNQAQYLEFRDTRYRASAAHQNGFGYGAIWDGDGTNANALITVFRHFDNASAMTGFHGDIPETVWVIDYPVFERIYYNLVAGFDVFGRISHQISTRVYMDELRMESEDAFLLFMPEDARKDIHDEWYRGVLAGLHTFWHSRRVNDSFPAGIGFQTDDPKREFLEFVLERGNGVWPIQDALNRCTGAECATEDEITKTLRSLTSQTGDWVKFLPDLSVLKVENKDGTEQFFTLIHNKAHTNIAFLFNEDARREPEEDTLTVLPEFVGSYPNFFFSVPADEVTTFADRLKSVTSQEDYVAFVAQYGVRRTSPAFWETSDAMHDAFFSQKPIQSGIFDLNRYRDPKAEDDPT